VTAWLKLALGLVALIQWIMTRLDEAERRKVTAALTEKVLRDEIDKIVADMRRAGAEPGGVSDPPERYFRD
jgi:hypothetical protein